MKPDLSAPQPHAPPTRLQWLALALVLTGSFWARCARWRDVFTADGVELLPSDSHYYVRFGLMQLGHFPVFRAFDPFLNYPEGAFNLWPPIHAWLVAAAIALAGTPRAELAAAWVGPAIGTVEAAVIALLALRASGARQAIATGWIYGLTPVLVWAGSVGNADHHVHEAFLVAFCSLTAGEALKTGARAPAIACGAMLGVGRLLTTSSFAIIPAIALAWPVAVWLKTRAPAATFKTGSTTAVACVGALMLSILLLGRPGSLEYQDVSLFHPLFAAATFCGALALTSWPRSRRTALLLATAAVAACLPLVIEFNRMAHHIGRVDAALAWVDESTPLLKDPRWAFELLGFTLLALPLGCWGAARALRAGDPTLAPALLCVGTFALAAAAQARFSQPLGGGLAVLLPAAVPWLVRPAWSPRVRRVLGGLATASAATLAFAFVPPPPEPTPDVVAKVRPTLKWMREHLPPATPDPFGEARPTYAVAASPLIGNFVMLWAERPTVAMMRSQAQVHDDGLLRNAAILASTDDEEAFARARASGVRYVLATPSDPPLGTVGPYDKKTALLGRLEDTAAIDEEDPTRTTGHFALVHDSAETRRRAEGGSYARLFEVVEGAVISGTAPEGGLAEASLVGPLAYRRASRIEAGGRFALRVPYAGHYVVKRGETSSAIDVSEDAVHAGARIDVAP